MFFSCLPKTAWPPTSIPNSLNLEFSQQWRRLAPGFAPRSLEELSEHLEQRLWIDHEELTALQKASVRDTGNAFTFNELDLISVADFSGELMLAKRFSARIQAAQAGDSNALEFVLAERLKSEAIISPNEIRNAIHVSSSALREALEVLENKGEIISGLLTETATEPEICDRQNFELLLRKLRDRNHPTLSIRPISELPIFTAEFLGLTQPESGELALQKSLEQLLALEVPLDTMETALLPARMNDFRPAALDHTFQETDLLWYGARDSKENPKVAFAFADQLDCARETNAENFAERPFDLAQLQSEFGFAEGEKQLWNRVFTGCCTTNSLGPIRRAQTRDFAPAPVQRSGFRRWSKRSEDTIWQPLPKPASSDQVAEAELAMERARILLSRYGVVFRERLEREAPKMRWSAVARAFRRMEYAGEVVSGPFFDTILGAQYASKSAVAALRKSSEPAAWWISSLDPLSPSGLPGFEGFPVRSAKTALFFFDSDLVIVGRKNGAELEIRNRDKIAETLEALKRYARRLPPNDLPGADNDFEIEKIDQSPAAQSNFAEIFTAAGFKRRYQSLVLIR